MEKLKSLLPRKILDSIEKVGISFKEISILSVWDIKMMTNMNESDIVLLKNIVNNDMCPKISSGSKLLIQDCIDEKVTTGCSVIDKILKGGFRKRALTEIYGESGSGKTQIGIQASLFNWSNGCVYICTDDLFPTKRIEQVKTSIPCYSANTDYGKNIFVKHITEPQELIACIRNGLPRFLNSNPVALIILDSVAAPFRTESTNYIRRAEDLKELGILLLKIAQEYNLAVVCVNQVSSTFDECNNIIPCLGLAWSNMVSTRLFLRKSLADNEDAKCVPKELIRNEQDNLYIRELSVKFAPNLPNSTATFVIDNSGIHGIRIKC